MAVNLSPVGGVAAQFFDNSGNVLTGGKIYTYTAGTTTPQITYTSATGVTAHSNPIILDASGRVPGGEIWLTDGLSYKFLVKTSTEVLIGSYDNIIGINSNFINFLTETEIQTATAGQTVFTLTTTQYQPGTNTLSVFVDGVNQYDGVSYSYVETNSTTVTFSAGLHVGALVKFTTAQTLSSGVTDASLVTFTGFNSQVGVVQDLADDDGSDWIGFEPDGTGAVARSAQDKMRDTVSVKDFGAVGDGVTDDTVAFTNAVSYINANGGQLYLDNGQYLVDAGVIDISRDGTIISGNGKGNPANLIPSTAAPTTLIFKGTGAGIRVRAQSVTLKDFRVTSDTTRAALTFDINSPGVRVEPNDTATARADRCSIHDLRIDKQPGDGVLTVASTVYASYERIDIYECKGFGFRLDPGTLTGLVRTNPHYVGLSDVLSCRVGFCGGHSIAASNASAVVQFHMAIRLTVYDMDSFGNGQDTSIMYPAADGNFYDFWIFSENSVIEKSAPCGRVGLALTPELMGGICIAGRDNQIINCRFIDTKQPVYWRYVSAQPSTGLEIDMFRLVNTSLTFTYMVDYESPLAKGLRVTYDRNDNLVYIAPPALGGGPTDQLVIFQGKPRHINSIYTTQSNISIADDAVYSFEFDGQSTILTYGVLSIACSDVSAGGGIFHIRCASTGPSAEATKWAGEANTVAYLGGGPLTGTTGVDGELTVSCDATKVYIENRRGFAIAFNLHLAASPLETGIVQ
jgi:hypothetical protein